MMMGDYGEEEDLTAQAAIKPSFAPPPTKPGGYTADDLDSIPDLPPHTELIDGGLVFVSPQRNFHMRALRLLERELDRSVPTDLIVVREMNILIDQFNKPEPDLSLVRADADSGPDQSTYPADAVVLAVEVVSPDTTKRDRVTKQKLYARAGIPHYWRVENNGQGEMAINVHTLNKARRYTVTGIFHGRLKVAEPFEIDIDLRITR